MSWTRGKVRSCHAFQKKGWTMREIAKALDVPRDEVVLLLFGGVQPEIDEQAEDAKSLISPDEKRRPAATGENAGTDQETSTSSGRRMAGVARKRGVTAGETAKGGAAVSAVKAKGRLEDANGVEPAPPVHHTGGGVPPSPTGFYRLGRADGSFLHESGLTTTMERKWAWRGTAAQLAAVRKRFHALTRDMKAEPAE